MRTKDRTLIIAGSLWIIVFTILSLAGQDSASDIFAAGFFMALSVVISPGLLILTLGISSHLKFRKEGSMPGKNMGLNIIRLASLIILVFALGVLVLLFVGFGGLGLFF